MDELVKELKNIVTKKDVRDDYLLMNSKYVPVKIESKNFHNIIAEKDYKTSKKVLFVDGGNSILFESAEFCIAFIRVGGIVYSNNKRINRKSQEFYLLIKENNGKYSVKTYPETSFNNIAFDPEDESLKNGLEKCGITRIVSVIRRLAEIEYANTQSANVDYVIMDGTLEARYPLEDKYLTQLFLSGKACALSKTCTLTTKNGLSITKKLLDLGSKTNSDKWYYYPSVTNNNPKHSAEMYFIKLNAKTNYVFRFEVQKNFNEKNNENNDSISELLSILASNSNDPIFLGYPYGLIDVDQYVRVSDDESRLLQTKLSTKLGKDWNELSKHLNSTNAHSILDKIKF
jgi:hypothetical protein